MYIEIYIKKNLGKLGIKYVYIFMQIFVKFTPRTGHKAGMGLC